MVASLATEGGAMTLQQMQANRQLMQEVMSRMMMKGQHYGTTPGSKKPSLLKAGAEMIFVMFRVREEMHTEDLSDDDCIRYRVTIRAIHIPTGQCVGEGIGECSTNEEKYMWRAARNRAEFDETPADRRRWKFGRSDNDDDGVNQVRTNPSDAANTILKMAKKRAKVDAALSFSAASDVFAQDLEDMEEWLREKESDGDETKAATGRYNKAQSTAKPKQTPPAGNAQTGPINPTQLAHLRSRIDHVGCEEKLVCLHFNIDTLESLPFDQLNKALKYVDGLKQEPPQ